jgi:hypothetical protein
MDNTPQGPFTSFDQEAPRRQAVRSLGAAGAALLGAIGMSAASTETRAKGKDKQVTSEKKGKKGKNGKRGPAGPAGPQGPPGPNDNTQYWARVDSDGTFVAGHGFVRSHNIGGKTGQYSVSTESEDVLFDSCAIVGMADAGNRIVLGSGGPGSATLRTQRFDNDVSMYLDADSGFSLVVICPATESKKR